MEGSVKSSIMSCTNTRILYIFARYYFLWHVVRDHHYIISRKSLLLDVGLPTGLVKQVGPQHPSCSRDPNQVLFSQIFIIIHSSINKPFLCCFFYFKLRIILPESSTATVLVLYRRYKNIYIM